MFYKVTLLDEEKTDLMVQHDVQNLKEAKKVANEMLTDPEYKNAAFKVEIRNDDNGCVWDKFAPLWDREA